MLDAPRIRQPVLGCIFAVLVGCAAGPHPGDVAPPAAQSAAQAQSQGRWDAAARLWEEAAETASADRAPGYRLNAADNWRLAGQPERATRALLRVDSSLLSAAGRSRHALLQAELALDEGDTLKAGFYLEAAAQELDVSLRPRFAQAQRRLAMQKSDPFSHSIAEAAAAIRDITDFQPAAAVSVLRILEDVPSSRLGELALGGSAVGEWAELALNVRRTLVGGADLLPAATHWEAGHPDHWANASLFMEVCWHYGQQFRLPSRIAVLLPDRGNLAPAATAIRDGLITALYDQQAGVELDFISSGEDPASALMAYTQVAEWGYQWVIGPLRRESVAKIAALEDRPLPVLLLNEPEQGAGPAGLPGAGMYSISLSQEAEARAIAQKIIHSGHKRVILLVADNVWGDRVEAAFSEAFAAYEGEVVALQRFGTSTEDHAVKLATLLRIEASRERRAALQAAIGLALEFEPSRRDDFDAIFMAADPVLGRQLKPQLRFFDAGHKPMFAMSRVFSGSVDPAADQDLDGVVFATTRWAIAEAGREAADPLTSVREGAFGSLHDLGSDALNVLPWLELLHKDPELAFAGATGQLKLDSGSHLARDPVWARFVRGRPLPDATAGGN